MRRPFASFFTAPLFWISPWSLSGVLLIQVVLLSISFTLLLSGVSSAFRVKAPVMFALSISSIWLSIQYGTSLGPEATSLFLANVAVVLFIKALHHGTVTRWAMITTLTSLSFAIRPGNPVLLIAVVGLSLVATRQFSGSRLRRLGPVVPVLVVFGLANRLFSWLYVEGAGHGSNFWATVYSAASPKASTWVDTYSIYADQGTELGTETLAFSRLLRNESVDLILRNPFPLFLQVLENFAVFIVRGWLNLFLGFPFRRRGQLSGIKEIASGERSVLEWESLGLIFLGLASALLSIGSLYTAYRLVRGVKWAPSVCHTHGRKLRGLLPRFDEFCAFNPRSAIISMATVSVIGAFLFFGLVGHDEDSRHLVMSVPWAMIGVAVVWSRPQPESTAPSTLRAVSRRSMLLSSLGLLLVAIAIGSVDSRHNPISLRIAEQCGNSNVGAWRVVASAPMSNDQSLGTTSDWRRVFPERTRHVDTPEFMQSGILSVSGGTLVSIRNTSSGEMTTVWLPSDQTLELRSGTATTYSLVDDDEFASAGLTLQPCQP